MFYLANLIRPRRSLPVDFTSSLPAHPALRGTGLVDDLDLPDQGHLSQVTDHPTSETIRPHFDRALTRCSGCGKQVTQADTPRR